MTTLNRASYSSTVAVPVDLLGAPWVGDGGGELASHYYRARYYDSKLARFLGEDPIGLDGGINFYAYVHNNPVNLVDPFGLKVVNCGVLPIVVKPEAGPPGLLPPGYTYEGSPDGVMDLPGGGWTKVRGKSWLPDNHVTVCRPIAPNPTPVTCTGGPCLIPGMMVELPGPPDDTWNLPSPMRTLPNIRRASECECKNACP